MIEHEESLRPLWENNPSRVSHIFVPCDLQYWSAKVIFSLPLGQKQYDNYGGSKRLFDWILGPPYGNKPMTGTSNLAKSTWLGRSWALEVNLLVSFC